MKPECWPCICMIAAMEHLNIKGCWFISKSHHSIQHYLIILVILYIELHYSIRNNKYWKQINSCFSFVLFYTKQLKMMKTAFT
jgi:hypothetical protein